MNWSDQHRVLWYTPMRTGTRSVGFIMQHLNFESDDDGRVPNHFKKIPEGKEDYYYVVNVRNPYSRLVSLYYLLNLHHSKNFGTNFEAWLENINPLFVFNNTFNISDSIQKKIDKVIKLENLNNDIESLYFIDKTDMELQIILEDKIRKNIFDKEFEFEKRNWKEYYNEKLADKIYSICEKDFINFGYEKNSWK